MVAVNATGDPAQALRPYSAEKWTYVGQAFSTAEEESCEPISCPFASSAQMIKLRDAALWAAYASGHPLWSYWWYAQGDVNCGNQPKGSLPATGGIEFGGSASVDGLLRAQITPAVGSAMTVPIAVSAGQTAAAVAEAARSESNASGAVTGHGFLAASKVIRASEVELVASAPGVSQNAITYSISGSVAGLKITPTTRRNFTGACDKTARLAALTAAVNAPFPVSQP